MANTSQNLEQKNKSSLKIFEYGCFFWFVLISVVVFVLLSAFVLWKIWPLTTYEFSLHFEDAIPVILTVLGVFIAFTAINMYSMFNSRVDEKKEDLEKARALYEQQEKKWASIHEEVIKIAREVKKMHGEMLPYRQRMEPVFDELYLQNSLRNAVDNNASILDRTTGVWKLIRLIEDKKNTIKNCNLINERKELLGDLKLLKYKIDLKIKNEKDSQINNEYLKRAITKLKELLYEDENTIN